MAKMKPLLRFKEDVNGLEVDAFNKREAWKMLCEKAGETGGTIPTLVDVKKIKRPVQEKVKPKRSVKKKAKDLVVLEDPKNDRKKRARQYLTAREKKFLTAIEDSSLQEAMASCGWDDVMVDKACLLNVFKKAYHSAVGLTELQIKFLKTFVKKLANIKQTCEAVKIHRTTYNQWKNDNLVFAEEVQAVEEGLFDDVESILYQKVFVDKDTTSLIWFTKTKMKHRGYTEKQEVDMNAHVTGDIRSFNKSANLSPEELQAEIDRYEAMMKKK
jgi:hypothetical protein